MKILTDNRIWVDPSPEGWKYGFPRIYDEEKDGSNMTEWIKSFGYPVDRFYVIRAWEVEDADL